MSKCPSLIDCSLEDLFAGGKLEEISREQFEIGRRRAWTLRSGSPVVARKPNIPLEFHKRSAY